MLLHVYIWKPQIHNFLKFVVPPSLAPCVSNNRLWLLNFWMACWYPKKFVHVYDKFKILRAQIFSNLRYLNKFYRWYYNSK